MPVTLSVTLASMNDVLRTAGKGLASGTSSKKGSEKDAPDEPCITYKPNPGVTPKAEVEALAAIYALVLEKQAVRVNETTDSKEAAEQGRIVETMPEKGKS